MVGSDKVKSLIKKKFPSLSSLGSDGNTSFLRAARAGHLDKVLEQLRNNVDINTSNANGLNALHLASKDGHVHVVTELLKRGANVDSATKKGNTALHIGSLAGQEEVVRLLVEAGASVNVQSQNGFTPLYMAAQENHDNVVKYLLANGANQSLATEDGFTPLAVAMQQGHDKVVAVLLENDTRGKVRLPALHIAAKKDDCKAAALLLQNEHNPDVTSKSGFTPLHIASHYGNEGIANLLLNKGADVNYAAKHNITPLHVAAKWGKSNMVSLLLEKGANIESKTRDGLTPLHCAARSGHEQVVDMLLERGAPISSKTKNGLAPLHMASQGDHVDAARILLYHRAPVDEVTVDYLTALHVAAHCGHARVAKLLLDRKADPNARALNGFTPLHIACKKNRIKVVELLLKHGASIEATTESGLTPLHVASFMGCMNIVIYLLQNEASPDVPTVRGETPLHLAARANQTDIIRILLRNGAQVDARAREQQTPLHIAARLGNVDIVMLLLQHGAQVDCTTKDLYSALHIAAKEGQDEVASVLLENGASPTATTKKGFTPLHLAAKYGNMKVARLLLQRDAPVDAQGKNGVTPLHVASHYDHQNVALLLLDKGASPHATAKNGHTPLHIAAKKNQMDIATTLLEYGAKANAESKAGFTPLHLSAQEGHMDMSSLLLDHQADTNHKAKNGLTPLHLCAQEDRVNVASTLVKNGAEVDASTKAGYTPLHVACHFGQLNMVRFLLDEGSKVNTTTSMGYTPLHQAAQQGHCAIVNTLLERGAPPNATTNQGQTAMSIALKLGYISVVETLKGVTEPTTITPSGDEKYKVVSPETMQETFMSDSEDEGGEDTLLSEQPYRYLTVDEMKSLGDDSLPIDVRQDERMDSNRECMTAVDDTISPQHLKETYSQFTSPDNIDISRHPLHVGFLVSFLVDARGGAMRGCRHSGVRVIVPPRRASMPMRVTCRYLKRDKLSHPPPLMEGEALASRILELGPVGAKFLGPVMIEVPHFGSLRGKEREIVILRSDNGETWREHTVDCSEEAVQDVLNHSFDKEADLAQLDDSSRTTRILTTDFPHYFAVVTRVRQEVHAIGPEGGMVSSSVVPQVQAVFPQGALTKKIKVGLQAQPIPAELAAKLLGNRVAVSPIVTVEPRRRKFHKPITLTIPKPQAANKGMLNQYSGDAPTLRLLCSITGGTTRAQWEDVTGSTPFTFVNDCVSFTTTVSARFWLMDCRNVGDATKMATELYREAIHVPFMAKFVVFAKRVDPLEARLRIFCMTDDKEDKTLEHQEHFTEVAKSRDVEVLEGKTQYVEFAGNLVPVTKSGEQLQLGFRAFRENRLPFTVRVKDPHADCIGRTLFMREARLPKGEPPQQPICVLNIVLPDEIIPEATMPEHELHKYSFIQDSSGLESYQRVDLRLSDISNLLGSDWVSLANELGVSPSDINRLKTEHPQSVAQQGLAMLRLWLSQAGNKAQASTLECALSKLGRDDIVQQCVFNVEPSGLQSLKDESRDASFRRSIPFSDKDIMKDSESVEDISRTSSKKAGDISEKDDKDERKYEAEEKEVDEIKKSVSERRKEIEKRLSLDKPLQQKAEAMSEKIALDKSEDASEKEIAEEKRVSSPEEEPSELSFEQKRLSFEQGKRMIEMKPDKTTMKEVKERADERFLSEERKAAEILQDKKSLVDETSIPFKEKKKSFEKSVKEEKTTEKSEEEKKENLRRDSALFEGVSQGLVRLDAAFTAAPQVQDLLSPKVSKTPPPSPAEFKDITGTVAWTEEPAPVIPTKPIQSQDWAGKGKPDSTLDSSNKDSSSPFQKNIINTIPEDKEVKILESPNKSNLLSETIEIETQEHLACEFIEKEQKYQFTMSVPDKEVLAQTMESLKKFLDNEKVFNDKFSTTTLDMPSALADTEVTSSDETEESQSKSESEPKSDKSFMGKMSKKLFGVFKKEDKEKLEKKRGNKKKHEKKFDNTKSNKINVDGLEVSDKTNISESFTKPGEDIIASNLDLSVKKVAEKGKSVVFEITPAEELDLIEDKSSESKVNINVNDNTTDKTTNHLIGQAGSNTENRIAETVPSSVKNDLTRSSILIGNEIDPLTLNCQINSKLESDPRTTNDLTDSQKLFQDSIDINQRIFTSFPGDESVTSDSLNNLGLSKKISRETLGETTENEPNIEKKIKSEFLVTGSVKTHKKEEDIKSKSVIIHHEIPVEKKDKTKSFFSSIFAKPEKSSNEDKLSGNKENITKSLQISDVQLDAGKFDLIEKNSGTNSSEIERCETDEKKFTSNEESELESNALEMSITKTQKTIEDVNIQKLTPKSTDKDMGNTEKNKSFIFSIFNKVEETSNNKKSKAVDSPISKSVAEVEFKALSGSDEASKTNNFFSGNSSKYQIGDQDIGDNTEMLMKTVSKKDIIEGFIEGDKISTNITKNGKMSPADEIKIENNFNVDKNTKDKETKPEVIDSSVFPFKTKEKDTNKHTKILLDTGENKNESESDVTITKDLVKEVKTKVFENLLPPEESQLKDQNKEETIKVVDCNLPGIERNTNFTVDSGTENITQKLQDDNKFNSTNNECLPVSSTYKSNSNKESECENQVESDSLSIKKSDDSDNFTFKNTIIEQFEVSKIMREPLKELGERLVDCKKEEKENSLSNAEEIEGLIKTSIICFNETKLDETCPTKLVKEFKSETSFSENKAKPEEPSNNNTSDFSKVMQNATCEIPNILVEDDICPVGDRVDNTLKGIPEPHSVADASEDQFNTTVYSVSDGIKGMRNEIVEQASKLVDSNNAALIKCNESILDEKFKNKEDSEDEDSFSVVENNNVTENSGFDFKSIITDANEVSSKVGSVFEVVGNVDKKFKDLSDPKSSVKENLVHERKPTDLSVSGTFKSSENKMSGKSDLVDFGNLPLKAVADEANPIEKSFKVEHSFTKKDMDKSTEDIGYKISTDSSKIVSSIPVMVSDSLKTDPYSKETDKVSKQLEKIVGAGVEKGKTTGLLVSEGITYTINEAAEQTSKLIDSGSVTSNLAKELIADGEIKHEIVLEEEGNFSQREKSISIESTSVDKCTKNLSESTLKDYDSTQIESAVQEIHSIKKNFQDTLEPQHSVMDSVKSVDENIKSTICNTATSIQKFINSDNTLAKNNEEATNKIKHAELVSSPFISNTSAENTYEKSSKLLNEKLDLNDSSQDISDRVKHNDDQLNNLLIDMLIEQECMKTPKNLILDPVDDNRAMSFEKHDTEVSEKLSKTIKPSEIKSANSFGKIEELISEDNAKKFSEKENPSEHSSYVTTPTMQRRKIGGSQRLSREERPTLREMLYTEDYSSSDDETSPYIVTEPSEQTFPNRIIFQVDSEDEASLKLSDSSSEPDIEVTEMTPSPIPTNNQTNISFKQNSFGELNDLSLLKNKSDSNIQKVERRFERMASETLEEDPSAKFTVEFQRMVSQLSQEEVDACLNQWDEGGLTPSEELDSTKDTIEGDLDHDVEALPEASLVSTNPFDTSGPQWMDCYLNNAPSSIFWAFDTSPTSAVIQPNELDILVKSIPCKGEPSSEEATKSPVSSTTREAEEALMDLAAGLQDSKGSGAGSGSVDPK